MKGNKSPSNTRKITATTTVTLVSVKNDQNFRNGIHNPVHNYL